MELKSYQSDAINCLEQYLTICESSNSPFEAWNKYWEANDRIIGTQKNDIPPYNDVLKNIPHVCLKIPTGGGKTFVATAALKNIFNHIQNKTKFVVWLVPSSSILQQTFRNLSDSSHPYRIKLNQDFSNRVNILTKEQLLEGRNFSPATVLENLSVAVLSYDSVRISNDKKKDRKIYQENGNLENFNSIQNDNYLLEDTPENALVQVIRKLNPVLVIDESHNTTSDLSTEMQLNLNPCFVLDLTATPSFNSNIISYVNAYKLKQEHMVKLPVIVFNLHSKNQVISNAISFRNDLEKEAILKKTAYIRPIVLFQAQPKIKDSSTTYEDIKKLLVQSGIPKEQIAIKTSDVDELKNVDLMDQNCKIRYVITVNALKEGWDCPFAYILATIANRSSKVEVEQIVGRILRLPYASDLNNVLLNSSYVFTCSDNFKETLDSVVDGLNAAGFSERDFKIGSNLDLEKEVQTEFDFENTAGVSLENKEERGEDYSKEYSQVNNSEIKAAQNTNEVEPEANIDESWFDPNVVKEATNEASTDNIKSSIKESVKQYNQNIKNVENHENDKTGAPHNMDTSIEIREEFKETINEIKLPQFFLKDNLSNLNVSEHQLDLFNQIEKEKDLILLDKTHLLSNFSLNKLDTKISFDSNPFDIAKLDVTDNGKSPERSSLSSSEQGLFTKKLSTLPSDEAKTYYSSLIFNELNRDNTLDEKDLKKYIDKIIENLDSNELDNISRNYLSYSSKIKEKIRKEKKQAQKEQFEFLIKNGKITLQESFSFPSYINGKGECLTIAKSLYEQVPSSRLNNLEHEMAHFLSGANNVKWWYRNPEREPIAGFCLNGFIHHYPDFIVMTQTGIIVLVETKGEQMPKDECIDRITLGSQWQFISGNNKYRYFMVYKDDPIEGALDFSTFKVTLEQTK